MTTRIKFKQISAIALTLVSAMSSSTPALARWTQGYGLISESGKTAIEDFGNGSTELYYLTESFGKKVVGKMLVDSVYQGVTSGVFHSLSTDETQGCYGRFKVKQTTPGVFESTWYFDGTIKGYFCPDVGTSINLPNMKFGKFSKWLE